MAHILLPTDLSEFSLNAAKKVIGLFGGPDNTYTLVHTYSAIGLADPMAPSMLPEIQKVHDEGLETFEKTLRRECDLSGAIVRRIVAFGPLPGVVDEVAREQDIDLVVMASAGGGSSFFGSHTTGVIQTTHVPVLEIPAETGTLSFRKVLFADDRSSIAPHTLDILAAIARLNGAEIVIVHVATGRPGSAQVDNSELFDRAFSGLKHRTIMVENDDVEEALFEIAGRENADLIALLHRHSGLWQGLMRPSTTKRVALHSTIPVLALEQ